MRSIKEANIHPKIKYVKYIKPIGITAHSRLGCKDDLSSHRHSFMFISFDLSFYITHYKIPIKTSVKYLATHFSFLLVMRGLGLGPKPRLGPGLSGLRLAKILSPALSPN